MGIKEKNLVLRKFFIYLILAIILLWPNFLIAQEIITLNEPTPGCLGSEAFVNLSWTSTISGTPTYYVLRKIQGELNFTEIGFTTSAFYTDRPVNSDKNYVYKIRAERGRDTFFSNEEIVLAAYCPPVISPPTSSCQADGPRINLSWSAISGNLSTYEVYRDAIKIASTLGTSFDDGPNLEGTRTYNYFIRAIWQDGIATSSDIVSKEAPTCPPTLNVSTECSTVTPGGPKVNLSWNSLLGVQSYQIYRKAQNETSFSLLKTSTTTSFVDNLVESLPTYWQGGNVSYYVKAIWQTAEKDSSTKTITIPRCPPYLKVESNCDEFSFRLFWTATLGATHYNIYRNDQFLYQNVGITSVSYIDYLDLTICPGQTCTYTYYVEAIVTGLPNFPSNSVTQSIDCATIAPPSPAPVLATPGAYCVSGDSRIKISWTPSDNVTYYGVYRNGVNIVNLLETSYVDSGVESGYEYTYYVAAYGKGGNSTISENTQTLKAVDCTPPSKSTLTLSTGCEVGKPFVKLNWTETTNTLSYEIWRGTSADNLALLITFDKTASEFTTRTWRNTGVSISTSYYYKVVSRGPTGVPPSSSDVKAIITQSCLPTTPVLSLSRACETGIPVVNLSWTTDGANTTRYEIFRKDYSQTTPIKIIYDIGVKTWKDNTGLSPATTYEYKVEAVGYLDTQRATQGYKSITTYDCSPPGPFTLTIDQTYCRGSYPWANLSWTVSSNADSYNLYQNRLNPDGTIAETTAFFNVTSPFTDRGFGNALNFDGYYDYVNVPQADSLNPTRITLEAWIYPTDFNFYGNIFNKRNPEQYILRLHDYTGQVLGGAYIGGAWRVCTTPSTIAAKLNQWNYVVFTYNGTTGRVYVNGVQGCTFSYTGNIAGGTSPLRIGTHHTGGTSSDRFKGRIDEVRIYGRAISATEVQEHYQGIYTNESELRGLWHFDEGSGQIVSDSSNYMNNGTLGAGAASETADPTWIKNGLQVNTKYTWQAKAIGPGGETFSNIAGPSLIPTCPPTKPGLVLSTFCEGSTGLPAVRLNWSYSIHASNYEIYRQDKGLIGTVSQSINPALRTLTDNNKGAGLSENTTYTYYIQPVGPTGLSNQSDFLSIVTPVCQTPTKPENLTATFACGGTGNSYPRVNLGWGDSQYTTSYSIYRNGTFVASISDTDSPTYTYIDAYPGVQVNTLYSYFVTAIGPAGSTPSDAVSTTTGYCPPSTPSIISITTDCQNFSPINTISWSDATPFNTFEYKIYRNTSNSPPTDPIITLASTTPEFSSRIWKDNLGLSPLTTYYYWVRASGPAGESSLSASKLISTYSCGLTPSTPSLNLDNLFCSENSPQATLSWTSSLNAYSYNLYRTNPDNSISTYSTRISPFTDKGSYALKFDGVDDFVEIPNHDSLNVKSITIEMWVKQTARHPSTWTYLLSKGDWGSYHIISEDVGSTNRIEFTVRVRGIDYRLRTSKALALGSWAHLIFTYDSVTGLQKTYWNGQPDTSASRTPGEIDTNTGPLRITGAKTAYFNGVIDEVRIYGRVLSASEIQKHYQGIYKNEADLRGVWHFDEGEGTTLFDSSGRRNNGKIAGPAWVAGKIAGALEFGGLNGYVQVPHSASLDIMTFETWFNSNKWEATNGWSSTIFNKYTDSNNMFRIAFDEGQNGVIAVSAKKNGLEIGRFGTGGTTLNGWHHLVVVFTNPVKIYLNKVDITSRNSNTWSRYTADNNLYIGSRKDGGYFSGLIDEARVYNRALSATEVTEHYNGIFTNETGLVGLWHFDEGSGLITYDDSPFGNNGTLIKGADWIVPSDAPATVYNKAPEREKLYKYYVKAFGVDKESSPSNEISIATLSCLPAKPDLTITPQCDGINPQLLLSWNLDPYNLTEYWSVYKRRVGEATFSHLINISPPTTSFSDGNVESSIAYEYFLGAVGKGESTFSDLLGKTAPFCYKPPYGGTPFSVTATPKCYGYSSRIEVKWPEDPTGNTISYDIWRKNNTLGEVDFSEIYTGLSPSVTQYVDVVEEENNYNYQVEAIGSGEGNSLFSLPSNATTSYACSTIPPFPPVLFLNLVYSVDHIIAVSLGWTDAGNEEEYKIFRSGSEFILIATTSADILNYIDYTVTDGLTYEYQVMATNVNGATLSNILSVYVPIARPGDFRLSGAWEDGNRIHLTWTVALTTEGGGPVTYEIRRSNSDTFDSYTFIYSTTTPVDFPADSILGCYDNNPTFLQRYYKAVATNNGGSTDSNIWQMGMPLPEWKEVAPW